MGMKQELCNKRFSLRIRLKLFGPTVSQTLLYAAGTWTLSRERERKLRAQEITGITKRSKKGKRGENAPRRKRRKGDKEKGN